MIRRNNEAQTASETNSTNDVGPAPDQAGYQLDCTEVWGGNNVADKLVKLPGLVGLIRSKPVEPATSGGDLYYVSACDKHLLSRVAAPPLFPRRPPCYRNSDKGNHPVV